MAGAGCGARSSSAGGHGPLITSYPVCRAAYSPRPVRYSPCRRQSGLNRRLSCSPPARCSDRPRYAPATDGIIETHLFLCWRGRQQKKTGRLKMCQVVVFWAGWRSGQGRTEPANPRCLTCLRSSTVYRCSPTVSICPPYTAVSPLSPSVHRIPPFPHSLQQQMGTGRTKTTQPPRPSGSHVALRLPPFRSRGGVVGAAL